MYTYLFSTVPCSVLELDPDNVRYLPHGPTLAVDAKQPDKFIDFLKSWHGEWMWLNIVTSYRT